MADTATDADRRKQPITTLEAALLLFGGLLMCVWLVTRATWGSPPDAFVPWALRAHLPLLLLFGLCLLVARKIPSSMAPLLRDRDTPGLTITMAVFATAAGLLGAPTDPLRLAMPLGRHEALVWAVLWLGLAVPVIEETYFRGLLQRALTRRPPGVVAILVASGAFGLAHLSAGPWYIHIALGVWFGIVAAVCRALLPAIAAHAGWNLGTVLRGQLPALDGGVVAIAMWLAGVFFLLLIITDALKAIEE